MEKKTTALNILFRGEVMNTIEKLQKHSGSKSKSEVIRDALRLYEILDEISQDKPLIVRHEGAKQGKKIILPKKNPIASDMD